MRFLHIRNHVESHQGHHISEMEVTCKGGMTIAYEVEHGRVFFSVAKCSSRDNYNRKVGRQIAEGRFNKGNNISIVSVLESQTPIEAILGAL